MVPRPPLVSSWPIDEATRLVVGGPLMQARPPFGSLAPARHFGQSSQSRFGISQHGYVGAHHPTERLRIDVDMNDARARRKVLRPANHAIVEAHANADDKVSVVHRQIGLHCPVHADHAQGLRVLLREGAQTKQRGPNRDVASLGEAQQLGRGARH